MSIGGPVAGLLLEPFALGRSFDPPPPNCGAPQDSGFGPPADAAMAVLLPPEPTPPTELLSMAGCNALSVFKYLL